MKQIKLIYVLLLAMALPLLIACTNDDLNNSDPTNQKGEKVTVRLRISPASTTMRAAGDWEDKIAEDDEMMNIWTVVIVDANEKVVEIQSCIPADANREIDDITELPVGSYTFYSFANIGATDLEKLLGFAEGTIPVPENDHVIVYKKANELSNVTFTSTKADAATISVKGNDFNPSEANGFGSYGIPMSNKQTLTIIEDTSVDLVVVRMLAKIKLEITNNGADDVTITYVTLTDITKNAEAGKDNLKLLPFYQSGGENDKVNYPHGSIRPNLAANASTDEFEKPCSLVITPNEKKTISFYINESATPPLDKNVFGRFHLKLGLSKKEDGAAAVTEERYALIDANGTYNNGTAEPDDKWNYIARNDYRIIPINLTDFMFEMVPYDFPAIGVHPASIKEEDGLNTITFHDYGHFHLLPKVTQFTTAGSIPVAFSSSTTPTWRFKGTTFSDSWKSWTDFSKSTEYNNATATVQFYATTANVDDGYGNANIDDGDDAGGVPVWYDNGATTATSWTRPKWAPDWSPETTPNYQPFIFGYIADPENSLREDRKVYHEFTIQISDGTSAAKELIYRLYMILDTSQMLYAPRTNAAPRVRCPHCTH